MTGMNITLFIAGGTVNSAVAQENLKYIVEQLGEISPNVTIVDLLKNPMQAMNEGVLVTPTLTIEYEGNRIVFIGTLEDKETISQQLRTSL